MTEDEVAAIYNEAQRKIKNVPGYAEAFKRVEIQFRKLLQDDYVETEQDRKQFGEALAELMFVEMMNEITQ